LREVRGSVKSTIGKEEWETKFCGKDGREKELISAFRGLKGTDEADRRKKKGQT